MSNKSKIKLVLLPGLDGTGRLFEPFISCLPSFIEPFIISYQPDACISIEELALFVESKLPEGEFVLLAESFSGLVALQLIPKVSSRLKGIIFVGAFASSPRPFLLPKLLYFPFLFKHSSLLPQWVLREFCIGWEASRDKSIWLQNVLKNVPGNTILHRLKQISQANFKNPIDIKCPSYYLQAKHDRLVPKEASKQLAKIISGLKIIPLNAPHFMLQAQPAQSVTAIENIFKIL